MSRGVLVAGGSLAGVKSALELADRGIKVTLVEEADALQSGASDKASMLRFAPLLLRAAHHPNIKVVNGANVERLRGEKGDFKVRVIQRPRFVNAEACVSCGKCEIECPVDIISADTGKKHKAIHRPQFGLKSVPAAYCIEKSGTSPCAAACPAGVNSHGYIALIAQGKFSEALDLITDSVPFPRVLGRVCHRPCESKCTRAKVDKAISICALKRFAADTNSASASLKRTHTNHNGHNGGIKPDAKPRVAIIGAGPAGLAAARDLARMGHPSTVFEALPSPGGMITVGMPRFRLPREVRQADIDDIVRLGIEIKTNTPIGRDLTLDDLKKQGYEAILIAVGAHKNQKLGIPGESLSGVINGLSLLRDLNLKQPVSTGSRIIVIGGGNVATDSARVAIRLGAKEVTIFYRRSREEMPANAEEVTEAEQEGVKFEFMVSPTRIVGQDGKGTGVEFHRMKITDGESEGRRRTAPIEGSEFVAEADTVIVAVGQRPDLSFLEGDNTLTEGRKHIVVDQNTMATRIPGIFAAGDAAHEIGPMINAIGMGRRAAVSIDKYLRGEPVEKEPVNKILPVEVDIMQLYVPPIKPQKMPLLPLKDRKDNFEEVELGFSAEAAMREAQRCLNCGGCSQCQECVRTCELNALEHTQTPQRLDFEVAAIMTSKEALTNVAASDSEVATVRPGIYFLTEDASHTSSMITEITAELQERIHISSHPKTLSKPVVSVAVSPLTALRTGVFVCGCGGNISNVIAIPEVLEHFRNLPGIAYTGNIGYACGEEDNTSLKSLIREHHLSHVVLAACSCCNFEQICFSCSDRRILCKSKLLENSDNGTYYEFVNIREHCAWVHRDQPEAATNKAVSLIEAGIARAVNSSLVPSARPIIPFVETLKCRACGTCVTVCPFEAVSLKEQAIGIAVSQIDEPKCRGCGICVAHCPSGALQQSGCNDRQIDASLAAILANK
ncbi:MAG: FAD-dependent oxidoreductase [Dehalococcoidales bacterium]|nr:FAD-dependent oxidoreductase [Dehalococcoidales bacterium]